MANTGPPLPTEPQTGDNGTDNNDQNQGGANTDPPPPIPGGGGNSGNGNSGGNGGSTGGVDPPPPIPPPKPDGKHPRPETPNSSVWYTVNTANRGRLREAANRVVEMAAPSTYGGVQPLEHAVTRASVLNNPKSIDWAVWELLIMLERCGYAGRPQQ